MTSRRRMTRRLVMPISLCVRRVRTCLLLLRLIIVAGSNTSRLFVRLLLFVRVLVAVLVRILALVAFFFLVVFVVVLIVVLVAAAP